MKTYTATRNIDHDQKRYEEGDKIELSDDHAEPLLACGAVVDPEVKPAITSRKKR